VRVYLYLTLGGIVWGVDIPNYYTGDKNLFRAVARAIDYAEKKGIAFIRLEDEVVRKDWWKHL
jgi:hypothetical protein